MANISQSAIARSNSLHHDDYDDYDEKGVMRSSLGILAIAL